MKSKHKFQDYQNKTINDWTVIGLEPCDENQQQIWKLMCKCGEIYCRRASVIIRGFSTGCVQCGREKQSKAKWKGGSCISSSMFSGCKGSAKDRGIHFSITIDDLEKQWAMQNGKCRYTNVSLTLPAHSRDKNYTASIDRTNSAVGYIPSNIAWVLKSINFMKSSLPEHEFLNLCRMVAMANPVIENE